MKVTQKNDADLEATAADGARQPLSEEAYAAIKQKIITLEFAPGAYLNVAAVIDALGIGRTPVHQAVRRLAHEGMIVKPVSLHDALAIAEVRLLNEAYCARLAANNASEKDIALLEGILERAGRAVEAGDTEALMLADRDFHCALSGIAHNQVLADILKNLHERSLRFWFISLHQQKHQAEVTKEHADILQAIKDRDANRAEEAMRFHIESFRNTIKRSV